MKDDPLRSVERANERRDEGFLFRRFTRIAEFLSRANENGVMILIVILLVVSGAVCYFSDSASLRLSTVMFTTLLVFITTGLWVVSLTMQFKRNFLLAHTRELSRVRALKWEAFERFVESLFMLRGYYVERRGGEKGDGGVDLILKREGERICVQCKQFREDKVPVHPVRELYGVMMLKNYERAIFVTSGEYSDLVFEEFEQNGRMELVDGAKLMRMLEEVQDNIPSDEEIDSAGLIGKFTSFIEEFLPPDDPTVIRPPRCKRCGTPMFLKEKEGKRFWACRKWPSCKGDKRALADHEASLLNN